MKALVHITFLNGEAVGPLPCTSFGFGDPYFSMKVVGCYDSVLFKLDNIKELSIKTQTINQVPEPTGHQNKEVI